MKRKRVPYSGTEETKNRVIRAALEVFTDLGFDNATLKDVRERAGVSNGSLYHHFGSKEGLAAAVYLSGIASYQESALHGLSPDTQAKKGVMLLVNRHFQWVEQNRDWALFLQQTRHADFMKTEDGAMAERNLKWGRTIGEWFQAQTFAGAFRPLGLALFLALVLGPCQEATRLHLEGILNDPLESVAREIGRGAWRSVKA